ncbi:hypothetical protein Hanom_Chr08g00756371 [Helianthus anomalus]
MLLHFVDYFGKWWLTVMILLQSPQLHWVLVIYTYIRSFFIRMLLLTNAHLVERLTMAESMLEATLQYQSGQNKAPPSPRYFRL